MWTKIKDYESYEINKKGQVRRKYITGKYSAIRKSFIDRNGYKQIILCKDGKSKHFTLHRLIALNFIPNLQNKPYVNHIDGNKANNSIKNLEWVTCKENYNHALNVTKVINSPQFVKGNIGEKSPNSVPFYIEYPDGKIIRYAGGLDFKRKTGFDQSIISYIKINKNCSHLFKKGNLKGLIVHFELVV